VNVRAVTELTARLLPGMVGRSRGGVINIASTAAWQGLKWLPVYSASKAYVVTFSEAVWVTLRGSGVRARDPKAGAVESLHRLLDDPRWNHRVTAEGGVLAEDSAALLREFFETRR
jgi:short-subunit dehydrogenase